MVLVEISVVPLGTSDTSLSRFVAQAIKVLENSELDYEITPMGTVIEGDLDRVLKICREMHESVFSNPEIKRVLTTIKIDDRRDKKGTMESKVESVEKKLTLNSR
jgi:uncharacterized protein (TIGR00106 family)